MSYDDVYNDLYRVDALSLCSLRLTLLFGKGVVGAATGFVVAHNGKPYLITNWHVVTGRDSETGQQLSDTAPTPDRIQIAHHVGSRLAAGPGVWTVREEPLFNEDWSPRWLQHPERSVKDNDDWSEYDADVVALPLVDLDDNVQLHPVADLSTEPDLLIYPGLQVSILGYPYAKSANGWFPIWKTGHVASDIDAPGYQRFFMVDATTREGMSGSPIICRPVGHYLKRDGTLGVADGKAAHFVGVYSSRIRKDAEIGIAWRRELLLEILENPAAGSIK